jgi:hypothetical protein
MLWHRRPPIQTARFLPPSQPCTSAGWQSPAAHRPPPPPPPQPPTTCGPHNPPQPPQPRPAPPLLAGHEADVCLYVALAAHRVGEGQLLAQLLEQHIRVAALVHVQQVRAAGVPARGAGPGPGPGVLGGALGGLRRVAAGVGRVRAAAASAAPAASARRPRTSRTPAPSWGLCPPP